MMAKKESASGLFWAVSYGITSIAITLFNKAVLSSYNFHYSALLTFCQAVFTLVSMLSLRRLGVINFPDITMRTAKQIFPLAMVSLFYIVISLSALSGVNLPMFTALRRTTILFVMVEEYLMMGTTPSRRICYSVVVMVLGAAIAASRDLSFDPYAYFLLFLTNLGTSLYTVKIAQVKKEWPELSVFAMLYYNTLLTLPVVTVLTFMQGDFSSALQHPEVGGFVFQVCFAMSCSLAFVMNLCTYFSSSMNGPTTQSVIGQLKNFVAFVLSLVLFSDYIFHPVNFAGLLIGFGGGLWYSWIKMRESRAKQILPYSDSSESDHANGKMDKMKVETANMSPFQKA